MLIQLAFDMPSTTFVLRLFGDQMNVCKLNDYLEALIGKISPDVHCFLCHQILTAKGRYERTRFGLDDDASFAIPLFSAFVEVLFVIIFLLLWLFRFRQDSGSGSYLQAVYLIRLNAKSASFKGVRVMFHKGIVRAMISSMIPYSSLCFSGLRLLM